MLVPLFLFYNMKKIFIIISLILISFDTNTTVMPKKIIKSLPCTINNINRYAINIGVRHPDIMIKVCRKETGHLKYVKNNNLFGMKLPKKRKTTAIGKTNNNYAVFRNWAECVQDWKIFEAQYKTRARLLRKIQRNYAKNKNYSLKNIKYLD